MKDSDHQSISRRKFIKNVTAAGVGVSALATGISVAQAAEQSQCKTKGCDYDVVVIGGGFAGVVAARDSMKNGYKTLLIEARSRLGGRTLSSEFDGTPIELGGTWIHNTQPFVWAEKERYNLDVIETPGAVPDVMYFILESGERISLTEEQLMEAVVGWDIYTAAAREIMPRPYDILHNKNAALAAEKVDALAHLNSLELTPVQRAFNLGMIETIVHNSAQQGSYLEVLRFHLLGGGYLPTFMDAVARFKLKDGTISLINEIMADGKPELKLSTSIKSVNDLGDKVVITSTQGEKITAAAVINCLPMNTIGNIEFTPPLPSRVVSAGKERHPGHGIKLYIKVKGDIGKVSTIAPNRPLNFVMTYKQGKDYTMLVAFSSDPKLLDVYNKKAVQSAVSEHLPDAKVLNSMSYDWNIDPFSQGTWASYRPGWLAKYHDHFQKEYGRLFFGTGDHGEGWRGTIDGAIGAGTKAAHKVKKLLG